MLAIQFSGKVIRKEVVSLLISMHLSLNRLVFKNRLKCTLSHVEKKTYLSIQNIRSKLYDESDEILSMVY